MTKQKVFVCGIGNKLKRDDGLGSFVVEKLKKRELPANVTVEDFGISGFKTALEIGNYDKVIFIDAVQKGRNPGEIYTSTLKREEFLESQSLDSRSVSVHESDLEKILASAAAIHVYPDEGLIIGCEPEDLSVGLGLSEKVEKSVDKIVEMVINQIN